MQALRLLSVGHLALTDVPRPVPGPDDILIKVEACGICGTDRHLFKGEFPSTPPVTLGHEYSGIIEAMGSSVTGFAIGDRITADPNISCGICPQCRLGRVNLCQNLIALGIHRDGGFAEYALVPQKQAFLLPKTLHPDHGAFCEPLACCIHALDIAAIKPGQSVIVLGGGVIGLLCVQLAKLAGASQIVLVTRQASRRSLAETLGATASFDPNDGDPLTRIPGGADVILECAGVAETVAQAPKLAKSGGTVVIVGVMPKGAKAEIEPFDLLFRELKILGSFVNPFTHRRAADLIATGKIKIDPLISRRVALAEAADAVANPPRPGEVKVLIVPRLPWPTVLQRQESSR